MNATLTDQEDKVLLTSIYKQMLNNNINVESIFSIKKDAELTHIFKQSSLKSRLMYLNDECEGLIVEIAKLKSKNILNKKEQSTLSQLKKELTTALSKKNKLEEALLINDICKTDNAANKPLNMQHIKALMAAHGATLDTSKSFTFALKNT